MSPTSYQAALPRVIPSLLSATLIIIPYSNGFVKRVRKVFLQRKQRMKTWLPTFFPESQQPRQFTPLREGRPVPFPQISTNSWRFQFTPLREGRPACHLTRRHLLISIHAPPRGATYGTGRSRAAFAHFNSRLSARGDPSHTWTRVEYLLFQFTPLREGRRKELTGFTARGNFNSRPSARGDLPAT